MVGTVLKTRETEFDILDQLGSPVDRELADISQLNHPSTRRLFAWWNAQVDATGGTPDRRAFDIADFLRDTTNMFLASKEDTGRWYYRIRGEGFLDLFGPRHQETCVDRYHYRVFSQSVSAYMNQVADSGACRYTTGIFQCRRIGPKKFESIDCPLLADNGSPGHIIGIAVVY